MKRTILVFGLVAGGIASLFMGISMTWMANHCTTGNADDMGISMLVGYASQLIAFSFIFVAIKSYRDKHQGGNITFWQACKIGLIISLIGSTMYVITWAFIYNLVMPDFMARFTEMSIEGARLAGKSAEEIAAITAEMADYQEIYKSPIGFTLFTYIEILPTGIIVTLISATILWLTRKKQDQVTA